MALVCECKHERKFHESGKEKLMDSSVSNCMITNCGCKSYHANYETRQMIWKIRYKAMFWSGLIIFSTILAGVIGYYVIEASVIGVLDQYTVKQNYHYVEQFANGTINHQSIHNSNISPQEEITTGAMFPLSFMLMIVGMFGSFGYYCSRMEMEYSNLVHEVA